MKSITVVSGIILSIGGSKAFTPSQTVSRCKSQLNFGIPNFGGGAGGEEKNNEAEKKKGKSNEEEKKIGLGGLMQMVAMGMGSPFLGDFEGVEEETGKMMFSLEANNLVDENGNSKQTSMPYFESGWVDEADAEKERKRKEGGGGFKFW